MYTILIYFDVYILTHWLPILFSDQITALHDQNNLLSEKALYIIHFDSPLSFCDLPVKSYQTCKLCSLSKNNRSNYLLKIL